MFLDFVWGGGYRYFAGDGAGIFFFPRYFSGCFWCVFRCVFGARCCSVPRCGCGLSAVRVGTGCVCNNISQCFFGVAVVVVAVVWCGCCVVVVVVVAAAVGVVGVIVVVVAVAVAVVGGGGWVRRAECVCARVCACSCTCVCVYACVRGTTREFPQSILQRQQRAIAMLVVGEGV